MESWHRIGRSADSGALTLVMFGTGVLAGVILIAMLPGMPWVTTIQDVADNTAALDLGAQRSMATAAWWMVAITIASGAVGTAGLYLIFRTLVEAKRSADAAEKAIIANQELGIAQVRAYLTVTEARVKVYDDDLGAYCEFTVQNSGQSPARQVTFMSSLTVLPWGKKGGADKLEFNNKSGCADVPAGKEVKGGSMFVEMDFAKVEATIRAFRATHQYIDIRLNFDLCYSDVFDIPRVEPFEFFLVLFPDRDVSDLTEMAFRPKGH
ncbi:hypothetical protein PSC71_13135 [Devosia sp. J2-20]|uniref:hypothetical protein n=1 Tax=Devosia sp. J2-20 TaxID=3026161 RepID=UPI00249A61B9|nr:hypothetical protein [Devosia sp. J2-20]WDQ98172.1 hypothetical protein PSC71_13135 [Devosia sp. J2-20]